MPKVSKVGKFRQAAAQEKKSVSSFPDANASSADDPHQQPPQHQQQLSRGQRKRQAKRDQYLKRQKLILSTLKLQKEQEQKKRIDGLDALKEALKGAASSTTPQQQQQATSTAVSHALDHNKSKRELTVREVTHMGLVLEHPAFQSNPFETLQLHLKNTLAGQAQQLQQASEQRTQAERLEQEQRKQLKKERLEGVKKKYGRKFRAARRTGRR
jgi:hypothetical protein